MDLELKVIAGSFSVCKLRDYSAVDPGSSFCFTGRTDEECSLVCLADDVPEETLERSDGWRAFRVVGTLDFSLIGILSDISGILAENRIGIFAVSTYDTDYILTKEDDFGPALEALSRNGYRIKGQGGEAVEPEKRISGK